MVPKLYTTLLLVVFNVMAFAQIGGESTYQFLELTNSARIAALGGNQIAINDKTDLNLPYHNPALLDAEMSNHLLANYVNYLSDINFGYVSYARTVEGIGNFAAGMHYINYGKFAEATEFGQLTGSQFRAAEYALSLIYSNQYKRVRYGATLKPILSVFESYQSVGIAGDAGISLSSKTGLTTIAIVARNFGTQITTYYEDGETEPIPFNVQAGISTKLAHAPVVISVTAQHLNNWDLTNVAPPEDEKDQYVFTEYNESVAKQLMRHLVIGVELLPTENFTLRAGYNYQRRQELKLQDHGSTVGFSFGFGLKVKRFRLDFASSRFHLAGSSNLFSLAINLNNDF